MKAVLTILLVAWLSIQPFGAVSAQTVEYIHTDALGTPVAVTDAGGNVIERSEYAPYGELLNRLAQDGPGFTGHVQDASTRLVYMQQRYYDPVVGRFLSVDPVSASFEPLKLFNRYRYGNNNPFTFYDLDGRQSSLAGSFTSSMPAYSPISAYGQKQQSNETNNNVGDDTDGDGRGDSDLRPGRPESGHERPAPGSERPTRASNTNPYSGPVSGPVIVVDGDGNAIPVEEGEQMNGSPDGRYQQVIGADGKPTGTRMDKGGHRGQSDPRAQGPHGHRPGVLEEGNPHLPLQEPRSN